MFFLSPAIEIHGQGDSQRLTKIQRDSERETHTDGGREESRDGVEGETERDRDTHTQGVGERSSTWLRLTPLNCKSPRTLTAGRDRRQGLPTPVKVAVLLLKETRSVCMPRKEGITKRK